MARGHGERVVVAEMLDAAKAARDGNGHRRALCPLQVARLDRTPRRSTTGCGVPELQGVIQHEARSHMRSDLQRYLFASCFAKEVGNFPDARPLSAGSSAEPRERQNGGSGSTPFADRFRVQCADQPSSTSSSHIAKDGHYYIHYDPSQCRSLTVREAARLQTFPDDYFFEGNRTQQYVQVGNAVPPLLARRSRRSSRISCRGRRSDRLNRTRACSARGESRRLEDQFRAGSVALPPVVSARSRRNERHDVRLRLAAFTPDPEQREVIDAGPQERLLVVAGPGSGKTQVAAMRLVRLLRSGLHPAQILVLSFSRSAVATLTKRISGLEIEDPSLLEDLRHLAIRTFDSWAFRMLRQGGASPAELLSQNSRREHRGGDAPA